MKRIISLLFLLTFIFVFPFNVFAYEDDEITLYLFHGDGCPHCAAEQDYLEEIQEKYPELEIIKYEVWYNYENAELLEKVEEKFKIKRSGVPTTVIGNTVISGYNESLSGKIERAIKYYMENDYEDVIVKIKADMYVEDKKDEDVKGQEKENVNDKIKDENYIVDEFSKQEKKSDESMTVDVPIFGKLNLKNVGLTTAAVVIGLIDGFNPCAMWILLFLISVLIGMKNRKRMWALGLTFLITSALVYMVIMLSWISIAVKITTVVLIRNIIAIIALIGAFVNIMSFIKSSDSGCEVVDDKKRKKIFSRIKKFTSEKSFILALLGIMGLAVSVNLVELACSAGLPLVFSELLALNDISSFMKFMYTLLYIIFFLLDDLIVFFIAMFTMKATGISTKYGKISHLIGGIIMLLIGVLLLVKPDLLMFNWR
ncbi:MAG: hypothetical protein HFE81_06560 [Bacilli bacterium]|nr:hypothetical protein [Bacilli bacterium]